MVYNTLYPGREERDRDGERAAAGGPGEPDGQHRGAAPGQGDAAERARQGQTGA